MIYLVVGVVIVFLTLVVIAQGYRSAAKDAKAELARQKTINAAVTVESETLKKVQDNLHQIEEQHRAENIEALTNTRRNAFESDWGGVPVSAGYVAPNSGATASSQADVTDYQGGRTDLS